MNDSPTSRQPIRETLAYLMAQGIGVLLIADLLGVSRQSVWAWTRRGRTAIRPRREHADQLRAIAAAVQHAEEHPTKWTKDSVRALLTAAASE